MTTKTFTWVPPTMNTDGTAITAGEVTGFEIGVSPKSRALVGDYVTKYQITGAGTITFSADFSPDNYVASIRTIGPVDSAWANEVTFTVTAPVPVPPSGFTVA